ncbi:hypothetical protein SEA_KABOCHA_115 [Gordonia phage Kabocha]|uniref:Uncharacterized protein n=1 Tax=Gordonia phage Chidiebere TaxID=2656530 RepID=A0A649VKR9_9CAUD|nr:hypothetical protein PQD14_gp114 [Gordonia phage Chidiebere]AZS07961.1 hypothetical protein PBI_GRAY_111 [Gordonia phage Gray]WAA19901.1 hypothetical protein SEA_KABOCHA_115 [Gordonia phage Kabocha]WAA20090.1 hypothetical protein SEA_HANEM_113 [Gordonia phage Hanem]WNM67133.1 hypothetical protein SEA_SCHOMBER_112 [Gordonia Phage Schomber]QGJ93000.1 hypothetical protein PBI_CHIDIEBERE_114 [Gordonia phage Chidiebere]
MVALGQAVTPVMNKLRDDMAKAAKSLAPVGEVLFWNARGVDISEEAIEKRRVTIMAVKASRVKDEKNGVRKRKPKFICPKHREPMVFSPDKQVWYCGTAGCYESRMPEIDRTEIHLVKSAPRLVGKQDEDGDVHWYVNFPDEGIMIEVPFQDGGVVHNPSDNSVNLTWNIKDYVTFDAKGKEVDITQPVD